MRGTSRRPIPESDYTTLKKRRLTPEILDDLHPDDPDAVRSRRDLRRINQLMGNYRWLSRQMREAGILEWIELGAGAGQLAEQFRPEERERIRVTGVDFAPRPLMWPEHWPWKRGDLFTFFRQDRFANGERRGVVANLFLHHFTDDKLSTLGRLLRERCDAVLACEPSRRRLHLRQGRIVTPFVNDVTRHDMIVSIEAGFRGDELVALFCDGDRHWSGGATETFLGAYRYQGRRFSLLPAEE